MYRARDRKNTEVRKMNELRIFPIGRIENNGKNVCVRLDPCYVEGLDGFEGLVIYRSCGGQTDVTTKKTEIR